MAGSTPPPVLLDHLDFRRLRVVYFYLSGIASRMIRAASCGVSAVASTSFAKVSKYDASSVWVISSCSILFTSCPVDLDLAFDLLHDCIIDEISCIIN